MNESNKETVCWATILITKKHGCHRVLEKSWLSVKNWLPMIKKTGLWQP